MKNRRQKPNKPISQSSNDQDDPEQSRLFIKKARELGADKDDNDRALRADRLIGQLAKKPPEPRKKADKS